jgi:hypothetical protein
VPFNSSLGLDLDLEKRIKSGRNVTPRADIDGPESQDEW